MVFRPSWESVFLPQYYWCVDVDARCNHCLSWLHGALWWYISALIKLCSTSNTTSQATAAWSPSEIHQDLGPRWRNSPHSQSGTIICGGVDTGPSIVSHCYRRLHVVLANVWHQCYSTSSPKLHHTKPWRHSTTTVVFSQLQSGKVHHTDRSDVVYWGWFHCVIVLVVWDSGKCLTAFLHNIQLSV